MKFVVLASNKAPLPFIGREGHYDYENFSLDLRIAPAEAPLGFISEQLSNSKENWDAVILWRVEWFTFLFEKMADWPIPVIALFTDWMMKIQKIEIVARFCNYILHCDHHAVEYQHSLGLKNCEYLQFQTTFSHTKQPPEYHKKDIDISMAGTCLDVWHGKRQWAQRRLAMELGKERVIYFRDGGLAEEDYNDLLRRSRLYLIHTVSSEHVAHIYEAMQAGAVVLIEAEHHNLLYDELLPGIHLETYEQSNLVQRARRLLDDPEKRIRMAERAYAATRHWDLLAALQRVARRLLEIGLPNLAAQGRSVRQQDSLERLDLLAPWCQQHYYYSKDIAHELFHQRAQQDPCSSPRVNDLGWYRLDKANCTFPEVATPLQRAIDLDPTNLAPHANLAQLHYYAALGIASDFPCIASVDPEDRAYHATKAKLLFNRTVELAERPEARLRGLVYFPNADERVFMEYLFVAARTLDPAQRERNQIETVIYLCLVKLGHLQLTLGELVEAEQALQRAHALSPDMALAELHLASLLEQQGRLNEAITLAEQTVQGVEIPQEYQMVLYGTLIRCHLRSARDLSNDVMRYLDTCIEYGEPFKPGIDYRNILEQLESCES